MIDPASIASQEAVEAAFDAALSGVNLSVLNIISERIDSVTKETSLAQILANTKADMALADELLAAGQTTVNNIALQSFHAMARGNDEWAEKFYTAAGVEQTPLLVTPETVDRINEALYGVKKTTAQMMKTSVLGIERNGKLVQFERYYKDAISEAVNAMTIGAEVEVQVGKELTKKVVTQSYQQTIKKTCEELSRSGLKVKYPSGRTMELNAAVRMNVMDNYRKTMSDLRWKQARDFGADGVEISAHGLCAPDHQEMQGRQFTLKEYQEKNDELDRPIEGPNCKHIVSPIIMGVSKAALSDSELEKMEKASNEDVTITGLNGQQRTMTRYEATQYQREIERKIRSVNEQLYLNPGDTAAKAAKKGYSAAYRRVSSEAGLTTRKERTQAYIAK